MSISKMGLFPFSWLSVKSFMLAAVVKISHSLSKTVIHTVEDFKASSLVKLHPTDALCCHYCHMNKTCQSRLWVFRMKTSMHFWNKSIITLNVFTLIKTKYSASPVTFVSLQSRQNMFFDN